VEHLHGIRCGKCGREHPISPRDYTAVGMKGQWLKSWRNEDGSQA
jgi:ribosome modulation factor